ncbi:DUF2909 domain-containing protein [Bacterioplanoides sp.]|uniref:DUF2909 domain-containing protein n=1 Tax=Bacterioplanoides sp. TaxID=2066072 RepID=UPI003B591A58
MLKLSIVITFILMLASLVAGAGFLIKNRPLQLLQSLSVRISLALLLALQLTAWFYLPQTT